jgi:hypothetical protein
MHRKHRHVLGLSLNCSEGERLRPGVTPNSRNLLSPQVLEPGRRQLGIAHRVLDGFVAEPRLQCLMSGRAISGCESYSIGYSRNRLEGAK